MLEGCVRGGVRGCEFNFFLFFGGLEISADNWSTDSRILSVLHFWHLGFTC